MYLAVFTDNGATYTSEDVTTGMLVAHEDGLIEILDVSNMMRLECGGWVDFKTWKDE